MNPISRLKKATKEVAFGDGGPVNSSEMFAKLDEGLTHICGPFQKSPLSSSVGKFKTIVHAGQAGKGKSVLTLLKELGFSTTFLSGNGFYGGNRMEDDGKMTIVNYNKFSGIVSITTQLK